MRDPTSLHIGSWSGKPSQAEDAFLQTLADAARRKGSKTCRALASEIERLTPSRGRWKPSSRPGVAHLARSLSEGSKETAFLRGAIAAMKSNLPWERLPNAPQAGAFNRRHACCTIVGPDNRVPSERILVGLLLIDGKTHYPLHRHAADELYLPLSGTLLAQVGEKPPTLAPPGQFLTIPSWTPHAFWTDKGSVLLAWAWLGEITGPYEIGDALLADRP